MAFMVYVPQMLIAAMAMNLGTKCAAATAALMAVTWNVGAHPHLETTSAAPAVTAGDGVARQGVA
jgi:hypothetical protein